MKASSLARASLCYHEQPTDVERPSRWAWICCGVSFDSGSLMHAFTGTQAITKILPRLIQIECEVHHAVMRQCLKHDLELIAGSLLRTTNCMHTPKHAAHLHCGMEVTGAKYLHPLALCIVRKFFANAGQDANHDMISTCCRTCTMWLWSIHKQTKTSLVCLTSSSWACCGLVDCLLLGAGFNPG